MPLFGWLLTLVVSVASNELRFLLGGLTAWTVDGHSVLYLSFIKVEDRHKKGISQVKCVPT